MKTTILIATHKQYRMPEDSVYLPIHVGKECSSLQLPYIGDNTGENISIKNPHYCELTAIYWAWKNLSADAIGLVHYRRHFSLRHPTLFCKDKFTYALNTTEVESLLQEYPLEQSELREHSAHSHQP